MNSGSGHILKSLSKSDKEYLYYKLNRILENLEDRSVITSINQIEELINILKN